MLANHSKSYSSLPPRFPPTPQPPNRTARAPGTRAPTIRLLPLCGAGVQYGFGPRMLAECRGVGGWDRGKG